MAKLIAICCIVLAMVLACYDSAEKGRRVRFDKKGKK